MRKWQIIRNLAILIMFGGQCAWSRGRDASGQFEELLSPAIYAQLAYYRSLKMRERILGLPLMITAILALLWRQFLRYAS